jgi:ABC-type lipoprotein release transport system permease subunit
LGALFPLVPTTDTRPVSSQKQLIRLIVMEGLKLVIAGIVFGFFGAAALLATLIPGDRAARVDPPVAIRVE